MNKRAIIIGAGPAGLTAAYELLKRTDIIPIILEKSGDIGGISKTINYKGNRMDIGGHRFFSKSDRVMQWWLNIMPIEPMAAKQFTVTYQRHSKTIKSEESPAPSGSQQTSDKVMLVRHRLSRIYFLRKFFTYPIQLSFDTLKKLGPFRTISIMVSYLWSRLFPKKPETNLEDFFINRFGNKLYRLFFKDYTEKVWGVPCAKISAEWGAQRIKGISITKALAHAVRSMRPKSTPPGEGIGQKHTETSLIEKFLYPKYGPGQLWEEVALQVKGMGGEIHFHQDVRRIHATGESIISIDSFDTETGRINTFCGDYFFSTMPVQELIAGMTSFVPSNVRRVAEGLEYRDFITVGVLLSKLVTKTMLPDTWIYIQERDVKVGRLQIFNNWSPSMVKDAGTVWIGMEYFCNTSDAFWRLSDQEIKFKAFAELSKMGLARAEDVLDSTVIRVEKTYPAYFGTYDRFDEIRKFTESFPNLFLIGRNGMHKYNNSDHSMLTAMVSVDNILAGVTAKANIWAVNTEQEYHEEKPTAFREADTALVIRQKPSSETLSFPDFILKRRSNRAYLILAVAAFILQFILFKLRYPYANYMPDSYSYINAAALNVDVSTWPIGYSKFLRLFSVFSHSDLLVTGFQYFLLQFCTILLAMTLFYFLTPSKLVKGIILVYIILSPLPLYMANYISADALFISLSLLWLSSLLWIIRKPSRGATLAQAFLLLACFTFRYNAIYYPVISCIAYVLSNQKWVYKIAGTCLSFLLVFGFYQYTSYQLKDVTGYQQFTPFGGWQLANNALYMYESIPPNDRIAVPAHFAKLEIMVRQHMDTLDRVKVSKEDSVSTFFYLWNRKGPLIQYLDREWQNDSTTPYFTRWATEGAIFKKYGMFLIQKYPWQYFKSWMLPNSIKYAIPPIECLGVYNMGRDSVTRPVQEWFKYKSMKIEDNNRSTKIGAMQWYPVLFAITNILFLFSIAGYFLFNDHRGVSTILAKFFILISILFFLNMGFSIFASPIVLRYQIFPTLVALMFALILFDNFYRVSLLNTKEIHSK